ncbi:hypothetical protein WT25_11175 [Burkholderia territorii]|uniref:hypothetical protein n=1 Tax=Burkholderia territorii TaxID=1503055 RepID=UPI000754B5ED|nr:hypothetical protein [Burkholderia territorii]KVT86308.1 hypothetical protein WT25_11175 [Burkholderia territorii]
MGEIAESMIDGSSCEECGEYIGEAVGFPRRCSECSEDDGGMVDTFRILKKQNQEMRAHNRLVSREELARRGYTFEVKNGDAHLIVNTANGVVDFWPGTGKYRIRSSQRFGRGLEQFLEECRPVISKNAGESEIQWAPHMTPFTIAAYENAGYRIVGAPQEIPK